MSTSVSALNFIPPADRSPDISPKPPLVSLATTPAPQAAWDIFSKFASFATPDAVVIGLPSSSGHFALIGPGTLTHYRSTAQLKIGAVGPVRTQTVNLTTMTTSTEAGLGASWKMGGGTGFFNMRGQVLEPRASVNFGWFGDAKALSSLVQRVPKLGPFVAQALQTSKVNASLAGGVGFAYRGTLDRDPNTGKWSVIVSGVKVPLDAFLPSKASDALGGNKGSSLSQLAINQAAYLDGANPFDVARNTRDAAGRYLNHGDPVSAIAGGVLQLQGQYPSDLPPITQNAQARRLLERVLDIRDRVQLPPAHQEQLKSLLGSLGKHGVFFGSQAIEQAAMPFSRSPADAQTRAFVRDVFEGDFRGRYRQDQLNDNLTALLSAHKALMPYLLLLPRPVADATTQGAQQYRKLLNQLFQPGGGYLGTLGLQRPSGSSAATAEEAVGSWVRNRGGQRLRDLGYQDTPNNLFQLVSSSQHRQDFANGAALSLLDPGSSRAARIAVDNMVKAKGLTEFQAEIALGNRMRHGGGLAAVIEAGTPPTPSSVTLSSFRQFGMGAQTAEAAHGLYTRLRQAHREGGADRPALSPDGAFKRVFQLFFLGQSRGGDSGALKEINGLALQNLDRPISHQARESIDEQRLINQGFKRGDSRLALLLYRSWVGAGKSADEAMSWLKSAYFNGGRAALIERLIPRVPQDVNREALSKAGMGREASGPANEAYLQLRQHHGMSAPEAWQQVWKSYFNGLANGGNAGALNAMNELNGRL